ncbi:MAG TPA: response regulator [Burkholderiales bacterium]|jgi:CheY-like chemotaxis protein|nr:response regulator [Burkholderiales bacterium]
MSANGQPDTFPAGLRVLLVEDESVVAMLLEDILGELGCKVVGPVARVDKAIEMAQHETLDAAILDVNLNGHDVYPVADALAARSIPFIFATGYGRDSLRPPYDDRPLLQKPFQQRDVDAAFAEVRAIKNAAGTGGESGGASG